MATAAQDQWLAALGVSTLRAKSGPKSGAETPSQADAATVTLGKIPVPHISGESKDALVKAMRTIDRIQPSERAKGFFTIVTAEGTNQIAKAEADDIRGKTGAAFKRNISATKLKAEAAMDRYSEQKKTKADQWAVSAAVSFARKVASVERFEDPGPTLTKEVEAARAWIAAAAAAADANSFARAAEAFADAEAAAARAAGMTQVYVTGMIEGAEASLTMLEGMRDLAFIAEGALATVATAGVASGAIAASTTAFGAGIGMPGAATVIATAAPIAGSLATAATKVALGDKVDWGAVALDASLQFFIARFGGPATKGIAAAVTKRLAGKLAAESIARMGIEKMVQGLILQEGSTALSTVAESTYAALRGKDITWEQFFKTLLTRLTDPKGIAVAAVVTAINSGAEMKYRGSSGPTVNAQGEGNEAPANEPPPPFAAARKPVTEPANAASAIPGENTAAQPAAAGSSSAPRQRPSGGASKSAGPSAAQPAPAPARPGKPRPPQFKDTKRYALTDFDKETAGTGGIKTIEKKAEPDALYGIAIEGELKDPIPRKNAPNYNQSDKIIDPEGPGLKPEEWEKAHLVGPGFGDEAEAGLMNAPKEINQFYQNRGVEGWMRDLHMQVKALGGRVTYKVKATAWDFPAGGWKPRSGAEFLKTAEYNVVVEIPGRPRQPIRVSIATAAPPQAKAKIEIDPKGAANPADLLS